MRTQQEKKNMRFVMQIRTILVTFAVAFLVGLIMPMSSNSYKIATVIWVAVFIFMFATYNPLYAKNYKVYVRDGMLFIESGVLIKSKRAVSIKNIQYIKQSQGFIQKFFYQYTIVVYTAGDTIYVGGLSIDSARRLRKKLVSWNEVEKLE